MKFMAQRAFLFSTIITLPILGILGKSNVGGLITYNADTVSVKVIAKTQNSDSLTIALNNFSELQKKMNSKLDTGMKRQIDYMQTQAFQNIKFDQLRDTINSLNTQLKIKTALPIQTIKDAEKGNAQKDMYKILIKIFILCLLIIGLIVGLYIQNYKRYFHNQLIHDDTKRNSK